MIKLYSYLKIRQSSRIHRIQTSNRQDYEKPNTQFLPSSLLIIQDTRIQFKDILRWMAWMYCGGQMQIVQIYARH